MKKVLILLGLVVGLAWTASAAACYSAGHGGGGDSTGCSVVPANPGSYATCWAGKGRATPYGSSSLSAAITPLVQPWMNGCYSGDSSATSAWILWEAGVDSWIQEGYYADCFWNGSTYIREPLKYFLYDTASGHSQYLWNWPNDGGHTFTINRSGNVYTPLIDGSQYFASVTLPTPTYDTQQISLEDQQHVQSGDPLAQICNAEKFSFHQDASWGTVNFGQMHGLHVLPYDFSRLWQVYLGFYAADYATPLP